MTTVTINTKLEKVYCPNPACRWEIQSGDFIVDGQCWSCASKIYAIPDHPLDQRFTCAQNVRVLDKPSPDDKGWTLVGRMGNSVVIFDPNRPGWTDFSLEKLAEWISKRK